MASFIFNFYILYILVRKTFCTNWNVGKLFFFFYASQAPSIESIVNLPSTYLMVLIMSKAENFELRNTIRQTWLRLSSKTPSLYIHKFVLGMDEKNSTILKEEMIKYSDIF
ncbi:hypothetical protein Mgra_00001228 [Meloidogyne graminicola]|uniref:Hexosyltransferase n=1 Tax=Meloidogyne graminicola TaxID=189291 RepID=A0A8T0A062_9BILA|nr:hypothetical protein Mgra_00001228 [Meloidogyne graminicola]